MGKGHPWVIASSALFFIPAVLAFFTQSLIVTIIFVNSATFSTLYHVKNEKQYADLDVVWASLAVAVALVMLAILSLHHAPWNWRVLLPVVFGVAGFVLYFSGGQASDTCDIENDGDYDVFHSLWHLFVAMAGTTLVLTPVDLSESQLSYLDLAKKISKNYNKTKFNEKTLWH